MSVPHERAPAAESQPIESAPPRAGHQHAGSKGAGDVSPQPIDPRYVRDGNGHNHFDRLRILKESEPVARLAELLRDMDALAENLDAFYEEHPPEAGCPCPFCRHVRIHGLELMMHTVQTTSRLLRILSSEIGTERPLTQAERGGKSGKPVARLGEGARR